MRRRVRVVVWPLSRRSVGGPVAREPNWPWALVFVGALHLFTATGTWQGGDHAEIILMSHRLVERGSFTLAPEGQSPPELHWKPSGRPRFFPGPALAFAPFVFADRLLGWHRPPHLGVLVHFASHVYVLAALGLLACAARRAGASTLATALLVLLLGTSWPLWQIVRRGGAEPVVAFWIAVFLWGSVAGSGWARGAACLLLPWTHPTGFLLAPTLALCQPVVPPGTPAPGRRPWLTRERAVHAGVALAGVASVLLIWNFLYHGDWWGGGYADAARSPWLANPPLKVWMQHYLVQCWLYVPILMLLSLLALAQGRRGLRLLLPPLALFLVISVFFSLYSPTLGQDFIRRLSVVWLGFGLAAGLAWDGLGLGRTVAAGLATLNLVIGVYWFQLLEFWHYRFPNDVNYPLVLWVGWLIEGRSPLLWGGYASACAVTAALACWKLRPLFAAAGDER